MASDLIVLSRAVSGSAAVSSLFFLLLMATATEAQDSGFDFGPEKKTHLHFFFHDVVSGPDPTAIRVAAAPSTNTSATNFGAVAVIDDRLTEGPDPASKLVGRAQGMTAMASQEEVALLMAVNLYFLGGDYGGSTISVLGRNGIFSARREMAVVGGTGYFRLARGYAVAKTHTASRTTGNAVVEYDVYVVHQGRPPGTPSPSSAGSRRLAASLSMLPLLISLLALRPAGRFS